MMRNHGHVFPRQDGKVTSCGGPSVCPECAIEFYRASQKSGAQPSSEDHRMRLTLKDMRSFS